MQAFQEAVMTLIFGGRAKNPQLWKTYTETLTSHFFLLGTRVGFLYNLFKKLFRQNVYTNESLFCMSLKSLELYLLQKY